MTITMTHAELHEALARGDVAVFDRRRQGRAIPEYARQVEGIASHHDRYGAAVVWLEARQQEGQG